MSISSHALRLLRHYSSQPITTPIAADIAAEARRKWGLTGIPSPRSILNDDDTPLPPSLSPLSEEENVPYSPFTNDPQNPSTNPIHLRKPPTKPTPNEWKIHRQALKQAFPNGWSPARKLSREAMHGLRELHRVDPERFTTPVLAERFRVSPEAVRRILKSKWEPTGERRLKWLEKEKREREERVERKLRMLDREVEETKELLLAKKFRGGLELREDS